MKKYKLWIRKYNIFKNDYEVVEKVITTNDIYNEIGYYKGLIDIVTDIEYWEHFNLDIDRYKRCKFFIEYLDLIVTYCKHNNCDVRLFKKLFLSRLLNWRKENVID